MDFSSCARIILREGSALLEPALFLERELCSRVLIVTDAGLVKAKVIAPILSALESGGFQTTVFAEVEPDPSTAVIYRAVESAGDVDAVIGIGGGSSLDTAKLVAYLLKSPGKLDDIYGVDVARGKRLPLALVPTTAGTGSEVTPIAIVTTDSGEKKGIVSRQLLPDIAILDPLTTLSVPPAATAATAIDAMVHAIEAYTSKRLKNQLSDALAREALKLLTTNFGTVMEEPSNTAARSAMLLGSCLAGMAFANAPVAAVHALAYPLGAKYHVPHGLSNALVLVAVMDFNGAAAEALYGELGDLLDKPGAGAEGLKAILKKLMNSSGLPKRLRDVGVDRSRLPELAKDAMLQTRLLQNNPRPLEYEDALRLYESVY